MANFGLIHLGMIAHVNKYGYYKYFPFSRDF